MAVGVMITMPGATQKQYEKINEHIFGHYPMEAGELPDGLLVHSAGPAPSGWCVYDVWESKDAFERFGRERIAPAVRAVTGKEFGDPQPQFFPIANLAPAVPVPARA